MSKYFYLKLFPIVLALGLLTISCNKKVVLGYPFDDGDDPPSDGEDKTTEIMIPAKGNHTYSSGYIVQGDYAPAKPTDGYATLANGVKYPESAFAEGIEGLVILSIHLLSDGTIQDVISLDNDVDFRLLGASIDAILSVDWSPAIENGVASDSYVTVPIQFILDN